jgi:hypothetical protein
MTKVVVTGLYITEARQIEAAVKALIASSPSAVVREAAQVRIEEGD